MTKTEAIKQLVETRTVSTAMLKPLGFSFESFLRLAQLPKEQADKVIDDLIRYYTSDTQEQKRMIAEAKQKISQR